MPSKRRHSSALPEETPEAMTKRTKKVDEVSNPQEPQNKSRNSIYETPGIVATAQAAAQVDANPPLIQLNKAIEAHKRNLSDDSNGEAIVYWMRMEDLRIVDNRALAAASECAVKNGIPLLVMFCFSPGDYRAHDRSPRRIDFVLRNLKDIKKKLDALSIPLYTFIHPKRKTVPEKVLELLKSWNTHDLFANIEYEVDELRRDLKLLELSSGAGIGCSLFHDRCLVAPGEVLTKGGKMPMVYTPWMKNWTAIIQAKPENLRESASPAPNRPSVREHPMLATMFQTPVPDVIPGFECEDIAHMEKLYPAGSDAADWILERFLTTKSRKSQVGDKSPLEPGAEVSTKKSRVVEYASQRDRADVDGTSRISPYLAAGVISARQCIRKLLKVQGGGFKTGRDSGFSVWIQEVGWRDFYTHILAAFPRVSMGRPFQEKYADVFWEEDVDGEVLQRWKDGKTGYPIVDAAMRQCNTQGYMHNRCRMIAAMFLTKDLMLDWRLGERYFMQNFIDGDLASNDGGWQWVASTGTDASPYFRVFNPLLQSEKTDPDGSYIRHFVPELRHLKGKFVHDPFGTLPKGEFKKLGYPEPIVDHKFAKERAVRRFKTVGAE
ncbi:hypothetical protein FRB94_000036 [Tulasnella sp. JGI-2019a]|nr:hypothetical protein FRB94_000036 [Tulasnella sp. JGI-2019a]KAG9015723.1 hypothetical protein FRB93_012287 [Tulasnella sp. JGI-2019a]KAG9039646.1 hypothetical protein FRB95_009227 [Tulasnella sp. JGI-2019a]